MEQKGVKVKLFAFLKKFIISIVSLRQKRNFNGTRILKPPRKPTVKTAKNFTRFFPPLGVN